MPRFSCKAVAVAVRAGHGIGLASRTKNDCVRERLAVRGDHPRGATVTDDNILYSFLYDMHAEGAAIFFQCRHDIPCPVGLRKDALAAFGLERHAKPFKKRLGVLGGKPRERGVKKARIGGDVREKLVLVAVVGDVAPPLSRDAELFAQTVVAFKERDLSPVLCRRDRRHHACGTAADDHHPCGVTIFSCHKRHISPIPPQGYGDARQARRASCARPQPRAR